MHLCVIKIDQKKIGFSVLKENLIFFIQVYRLMLKLHVRQASMCASVLLHTVSSWVTLTTGRVFSSHITKPHCSGTTVRIVGSISAVTRTTDSLVPILTNCISTVSLKHNKQPTFWHAVNVEQRTKGLLSDERRRMSTGH